MPEPKILSTETDLCPLCDDEGEIGISLSTNPDCPIDVLIDCPICPKHPLQWTSHTEPQSLGWFSAFANTSCTTNHPAPQLDSESPSDDPKSSTIIRYGRIT